MCYCIQNTDTILFAFNFNINDHRRGLARYTYIKKFLKSIATNKISLYQSSRYLNSSNHYRWMMLRQYRDCILTSGGSYECGNNLGSISMDGSWSVTLLLIIHEVSC